MNERAKRVEQAFEIPTLIAALMVIPVVAIAESTTSVTVKNIGLAMNWISWATFALEAVAMLSVVDSKREWLKSHPLEILIVLLTPPVLPREFGAVRLIRLLLLVRLFRVAKYVRKLTSDSGLAYAAVITIIVTFVGGALLAATEKPRMSTWDGIWVAVQTITTVGYGDIYPDTTAGRIVAIVIMFVGIGFVVLLTAAAAERFIEPELEEGVEEVLGEVEDVMVPERKILDRLDDFGQRLEAIERKL